MTKQINPHTKTAVTLENWQWQHVLDTIGDFPDCAVCGDLERNIRKQVMKENP